MKDEKPFIDMTKKDLQIALIKALRELREAREAAANELEDIGDQLNSECDTVVNGGDVRWSIHQSFLRALEPFVRHCSRMILARAVELRGAK